MRRFRVLLVALLVAVFVVSTPARMCMAATSIPYNTIIWGPSPRFFGLVDSTAVIVCARNRFAAAMTILGYGTRVDSLTPVQMAYLSNGSTGGEFFTFANNVRHRNGLVSFDNYDDLYGHDNVWYCEYSSSEYSSAKRDLEIVLNGGIIGGGGGSDSGEYYYFRGNVCYSSYDGYGAANGYILGSDNKRYTGYSKFASSNNSYYVFPKELEVKINKDSLSSVVERYPINQYDYTLYLQFYNGKVSYIYILVGGTISKSTNNIMVDGEQVNTEYINGVSNCVAQSSTYGTAATNLNIVYDNGIITFPDNFNSGSANAGGGYSSSGGDRVFLSMDSSGGTPTVPPTNWPDAPEVTPPSSPDVPTPSEPDLPTQPSTPTAPTLPDFPSNVIAPGTTYETFDIQAILDAMDEHCQHLQSAVYQGFSDYFDTFTPWLRDEFSTLRTFLREEDDWIVESISDEFMELRTYMKELAEWLADQMDFTITGGDYDDSTVVSWLKKIYYKLGGASVNTKPVDPVGDPDGSWDWLSQLIEAILSALASGAAGLAGTLGDLFQGIKDKFPFSIPWDIVAIVALLDAPPVTPAAVIEYDVFGAHVRYDIDLHFFDEQASVIRAMEDVLFCAFLLFKTDWLTGIFDGIGGFLGGKLKSTVKGV